MNIREAIKTKSFESSFHKALVNLRFTYNWYNIQETKVCKQFGIQPQHYNVLRIVKGKHPEPASPGYIISVMLDKGRDLTRLVDKLVKLGFLERKTCEDNRRKVDITITPKGLQLYDELTIQVNRFISDIKHLNEDEAAHLSDLLDQLRG